MYVCVCLRRNETYYILNKLSMLNRQTRRLKWYVCEQVVDVPVQKGILNHVGMCRDGTAYLLLSYFYAVSSLSRNQVHSGPKKWSWVIKFQFWVRHFWLSNNWVEYEQNRFVRKHRRDGLVGYDAALTQLRSWVQFPFLVQPLSLR